MIADLATAAFLHPPVARNVRKADFPVFSCHFPTVFPLIGLPACLQPSPFPHETLYLRANCREVIVSVKPALRSCGIGRELIPHLFGADPEKPYLVLKSRDAGYARWVHEESLRHFVGSAYG